MKGVTYQLKQFLGPMDTCSIREDSGDSKTAVSQSESVQKNTLYHIILYLAPGDCHHFHSPVNWNVSLRRHFPGMFN